MNDMHEGRLSVYEIGYLIVPSVPEEKVPAEEAAIQKLIADTGAEVLAEEAPRRIPLAYTMRVKMVSGAYDKHDEAYFGWIKFEVGSDKIEALKKAVELMPSMLRMMVMSTVREATYLGKRAASMLAKPAIAVTEETKAAPAAPVTIEEMDKSIDALVKEV